MSALRKRRPQPEPAEPRPPLALAPLELAGAFWHEGHRLEYTEYGHGDDVVVLAHGVTLSRRMHRPLARRLAREGFRVVTVDLLGHGGSDRPTESWQYSMSGYGEQLIALLDHLDVDRAIVGGTSLGANASLEAAVLAPERLIGLLVEMPALDNAVFACTVLFPPLMFAARFAPLTVRAVSSAASLVPHGNVWVDVVTDVLQQEPAAFAAMLHGIIFGRVAPPRSVRQRIQTPALVIGHSRDPIHPFGDADTLASDMPNATFLRAVSPVELRFRPERLTQAIAGYLHERFDTAAAQAS